ncbi:hypothetical protein DIPPA_13221 [Diplonema papillatum]|nr:hypothetical protein DIPPA_13221 [Diplonema papillatum]
MSNSHWEPEAVVEPTAPPASAVFRNEDSLRQRRSRSVSRARAESEIGSLQAELADAREREAHLVSELYATRTMLKQASRPQGLYYCSFCLYVVLAVIALLLVGTMMFIHSLTCFSPLGIGMPLFFRFVDEVVDYFD